MFLAEYGARPQRVADYGRIYGVQYQSCSPSAVDGIGHRRPQCDPWHGEELHSSGYTRMMLGASLGIGILTALAMFALTFVLPRGTAMRDAVLVQFPMTVGVWAIFGFALREIEVGSSVQVNGSLSRTFPIAKIERRISPTSRTGLATEVF
jgi:hypothetical protein